MAQRTAGAQTIASSLGISHSSLSEIEIHMRRILTLKSKQVELKMSKPFWLGLTACFVLFAIGITFAQVPTTVPTTVPATQVQQNQDQADEVSSQVLENDRPEPGNSADDPLTIAGKVVDVAGRPVGGAIVDVNSSYARINTSITANDDGTFRLSLRIEPKATSGLQISARARDSSLLGFYRVPQTVDVPDLEAVEIRIEPIKSAKVKVVDASGKPIEDANVAIQLDYPITTGPEATDADGMAAIPLPESETIQAVVAWKDHAGLDYKLYTLPRKQTDDLLTKKPEFPANAFETLALEGASPLTVRIVDVTGDPIPGTQAHVWLLQKETQSDHLNFSFFTNAFIESTDASGTVTFAWFPNWQTGPTTIWPTAEGFVRARGEYDPATKNGALEIQLERQIPIRGTVTFPDGKPAVSVAVGASGAGYTWDGFHGVTKTDTSGRYEFMATPNQIYILYIADKQWSAPAQSGFAVLPGHDIDDRNFVLSPSSRVFGRVLNDQSGDPVAGKYVFLTQHGIELNSMGDDVLPNPEGSRLWVVPIRQQGTKVGNDGKFEFFVGEGEYNLFIQGFDAEKFSISQEAEKSIDLRIAVQTKKLFTGSVVDDQSNEPTAGAQIEAISRNFSQDNDWKAGTAADGKFQVERVSEPIYLYVTSPDAMRGAIAEIDAEQSTVELRLAELGSATGYLLTEDGSQPAAGVKLIYGIRIEDEKQGVSSSRFGKVITTDAGGKFTLPSLVPGWDYELTVHEHPSGYVLNLANVSVEPGESEQLGELKTPEPPKPYVPPTLEERTQAAFTLPGTPLERFEKAKQLIDQVNQNLLIVFADPADIRVKSLMQIRYEDQDFRPYQDDFRFMAISTAADALESAQDLAGSLKVASIRPDRGFLMVLLNRDAQVIAKISDDQVCDADEVSKDLLFAELDKHKTTPLDARELLDTALATARRENKRVIVQETATWCGPCHMLSGLLQRNHDWEKDYVWVKMDHRWTGAVEIMKQLREGADGGIPWFAILDAQGNKLATSNLPESGRNIGFPSEAEGQEHFVNMLKSTRQRMTDQEIVDLASAAKGE